MSLPHTHTLNQYLFPPGRETSETGFSFFFQIGILRRESYIQRLQLVFDGISPSLHLPKKEVMFYFGLFVCLFICPSDN